MKKSDPIVIEYLNNNATSTNVIVFNANFATSKLPSGQFIPNNGNNPKVTVPSTIGGGIPYSAFLQSIKSQPFRFNKVYIQSNNSQQLTQTMRFIYANSFGNIKTDIVSPKLDPMQNQSTVLMQSAEMVVDGYSSVRFTLLGNTTVTLSFYPSQELNLANNLIGEDAIQKYRFGSISQFDV